MSVYGKADAGKYSIIHEHTRIMLCKIPNSALLLLPLTDILVIRVGVPGGLAAEVPGEKIDKATHLG